MFLTVVVAATAILYYPALHRMFASDQLCYLAELNGSESLWDGLRHYDYAVSRQYAKGDESLYRPLLFVWLAVNHWLFGADYFWWNVVNLGLHVVIVFLLFALLRTLQPSPAAAMFALLFAVFSSQAELVMWNHLGGYLLGYAFFLLGLIAAQRAIDGQRPQRSSWLAIYALSMTVASLFYEVLVVMSALAGLYLLYRELRRPQERDWRVVPAALIPGVVFCGLYVLHCMACPRWLYVFGARHGEYAVLMMIDQAIYQVQTWLQQTVCPWNYVHVPDPLERTSLSRLPASKVSAAVVQVMVAASVVLAAGLLWRVREAHFRRSLSLAMALLAMIAAYSLLISVGRQGVYAGSPYYLYFFSLMLIILVYNTPDWNCKAIHLLPTVSGLAVFIVVNGCLLYSATRAVQAVNREPDRYFTSIRQFIAAHREEPGFSFAIGETAPSNGVDTIMPFVVGYPDVSTY